MTTYYRTTGSVRGDCGHRHRTLSGAIRCLRRDQSGCAGQGGYSDRRIVEIDDDGEENAWDEYEEGLWMREALEQEDYPL